MSVYQGQEYYTLPYSPMDPERTEATSSIMRRGNEEIKRLHKALRKANKLGPNQYIRAEFRQELFDWLASMNGQVSRRIDPKGRVGRPSKKPLLFVPSVTKNPRCGFVFDDEGKRKKAPKPRGVRISNRALSRIVAVRNIQDEVLCGFSRLFERLAIRFWSNHKEQTLGVQDYYDEAVMAGINAIYHYTREDVEFITYLYHCVRRRMGTATVKDNPLSPWSNDARRLHRMYEDARASMNRPTTFAEVCEYCQFTDAEARLVELTLAEVVQAWDFAGGGESRHQAVEAYEENHVRTNGRQNNCNGLYRSGLHLGNFHDGEEELRLDIDQRAAVERARAKMTEFERAVLDAYLNDGEWGWQSRVAEQHINPKTELPYSRRAPAVLWPRIVRTILEEYQGEEIDAVKVA